MKCPKCESDNIFQISTGQNICRDCENVFALEEPLRSHIKTQKSQSTLTYSTLNMMPIFLTMAKLISKTVVVFFTVCLLVEGMRLAIAAYDYHQWQKARKQAQTELDRCLKNPDADINECGRLFKQAFPEYY